MAERKWGDPIWLPQEKIDSFNQEFGNRLEQTRKADGVTIDESYLKADHVLESRGDCAWAFLQEGLLPALNDNNELAIPEVLEIASAFIESFKKQHPKDFDLNDPYALAFIAQSHIFIAGLYYDMEKDPFEDQKIKELIERADILLDALHKESDDLDEEEI